MHASAEMRTQQVGAGDSPCSASPRRSLHPPPSPGVFLGKTTKTPRPLLTWGVRTLCLGRLRSWVTASPGRSGLGGLFRPNRCTQHARVWRRCPAGYAGTRGRLPQPPAARPCLSPSRVPPRSVPPPRSACAGGGVRPLHVALFTEFQYRHVPAEDPGVPPGHVPAAASW